MMTFTCPNETCNFHQKKNSPYNNKPEKLKLFYQSWDILTAACFPAYVISTETYEHQSSEYNPVICYTDRTAVRTAVTEN